MKLFEMFGTVTEAPQRSHDQWIELVSLTATQDEAALMDAVMNDNIEGYVRATAYNLNVPDELVKSVSNYVSDTIEIPDPGAHGHRILDPRDKMQWEKENEGVNEIRPVDVNVVGDEGAFSEVADALYDQRPDLFTEHGDEFIVSEIEEVLKNGNGAGDVQRTVEIIIDKLEGGLAEADRPDVDASDDEIDQAMAAGEVEQFPKKGKVSVNYSDVMPDKVDEAKSGPFKSKAIGSKVKVHGGDHDGKIGTISNAERTHTFSKMVPFVIEYGIDFDDGSRGWVRRESTKKIKTAKVAEIIAKLEGQETKGLVEGKAGDAFEVGAMMLGSHPELLKQHGDEYVMSVIVDVLAQSDTRNLNRVLHTVISRLDGSYRRGQSTNEAKEIECPHCDGSGENSSPYDDSKCKACDGSGKVSDLDEAGDSPVEKTIGMGDTRSAKELKNQIRELSDEVLLLWAFGQVSRFDAKVKKMQTKLIASELRRRGLRPFKYGDKVESIKNSGGNYELIGMKGNIAKVQSDSDIMYDVELSDLRHVLKQKAT